MRLSPWLEVAACAGGTVFASLRWLRVAQREHYLPGSCGRFGRRWWFGTGRSNRALAGLGIAGVCGALFFPPAAVLTAAAVAVGPTGLGIKGRSKPMVWTRRMRTLVVVYATEQLTLLAVGLGVGLVNVPIGVVIVGLSAIFVPVFVDVALVITLPLEKRGAKAWIDKASVRLNQVGPIVVGITGSFGKTTTKGYVAHLSSESKAVIASPASFNNALGLARTVNEHLLPGTEVLVAEMGAYGRGEIAALCEWMKPTIGIITALGPVHLERFGSEQEIARAKSELLQSAPINVLNADHPSLEQIAVQMAASGKRVWRCSEKEESRANVYVYRTEGLAHIEVRPPQHAPCGTAPLVGSFESEGSALTNVACAVAAALELGIDWNVILRRIGALSASQHRLEVQRGTSGATVIDDTYNSNPSGARLALQVLKTTAQANGKIVLVTPGMVELGPIQEAENAKFAQDACDIVTDLVIVGRTNKKALFSGVQMAQAKGNAVRVKWFATREQAVNWLRGELGPSDAVLYENDLPDHFA